MAKPVLSYDDFSWTTPGDLACRAARNEPWDFYRQTEVHIAGHGTVTPSDAPESDDPPLGALHVIAAVQPDGEPNSDDSAARLAVLDRELAVRGIRAIPAIGAGLDSDYQEESRAVLGLNDVEARELGLRYGQVAIFAWNGPRWSLLACATDRQDHRGWCWTPER